MDVIITDTVEDMRYRTFVLSSSNPVRRYERIQLRSNFKYLFAAVTGGWDSGNSGERTLNDWTFSHRGENTTLEIDFVHTSNAYTGLRFEKDRT